MKYIGENLIKTLNAGSKARTDIENVLHERYDCLFNIDEEKSSCDKLVNLLWKIEFFLKKYKTIHQLKKGSNSVTILQYPFYFKRKFNALLRDFIAHNETVVFVHDIDSLRNFGNSKFEDEVHLLNKANMIIVHNRFMKDYLCSHGITTTVVELQLFDYLLTQLPSNENGRIHFGKEIVFAGNLFKSQFLPLLSNSDRRLIWNLYGNRLPEGIAQQENINWKGSYGSDEIPFILEGSFGLIWDGDSLETCSGPMGNYLRYNNPHKLSLYIAAGMPVITWSQAAISELVAAYNIGFTVDNIDQIPTKIDHLNENEYSQYIENIKKLQAKVVKGEFTKQALDMVEKE